MFVESLHQVKNAVWFNASTNIVDSVNGAANDVAIAICTVSPSAHDRTRVGERRYNALAPSGWEYILDVEYGDPRLPAHTWVFYKVIDTANESWEFTLQRQNQILNEGNDRIRFSTDVVTYRNVDINTPINNSNQAARLGDELQLTITRSNSIILTGLMIFKPQVNLSGIHRVERADFELVESVQTDRGPTGVTPVNFDDASAGRFMIALTPNTGGNISPPPLTGTGVGRAWRETELASPLQLKTYELNSQNELVETENPIEALSAELNFNRIGACTGGVVVAASGDSRQGLLLEPYSRFFEFFLTPITKIKGYDVTNPPEMWYSGLLGAFSNRHPGNGYMQVPIIGSYDLVKDGAIGQSTVPNRPPFITSAIVLNEGVPVDIIPGTVDDWQTFEEYHKLVFNGMDDVDWGVGPDRKFIRGRAQDGNYLKIDASEFNPQPSQSGITDYVTSWYLPKDDEINLITDFGARTDLGPNVPERTVKVERKGDGTAIIPAGYNKRIWDVQSYDLEFPGILIPPVLFFDLALGRMQFASRAQVIVGINGSVIKTKIKTQNLKSKIGRQSALN